mmetsp:Transcript_22828/g.52228  ORF Transcript_22828/g.52228 Transcript_22828/m.52228 type:complete len:640 (-) Transcript_22828:54-1973(-)
MVSHGVPGLAEAHADGQVKLLQLMQEARQQHKRMMDAHEADQEAFMEKMVLKCQTILTDTVKGFVDTEMAATLANAAFANTREQGSTRLTEIDDKVDQQNKEDAREPFKAGRSFLYANVGNGLWQRRIEAMLDHLPNSMRNNMLARQMQVCAERMDHWVQRRAAYHSTREDRCAGRLVHHPVFEALCMLVIFLNVGYTIHSTDTTMRHLTENPNMAMFAIDVGFLAFYTFEVCLRIYVYRWYYFFSFDWVWNWFDAVILLLGYADVLITLAIVESTSRRTNPIFLRLLRVIRISKAMRVLRGIRFCWELQFSFDMVRKSVMSFLWCSMVAIFFNMFFALIMVQLSAQSLIEGGVASDLQEEVRSDFGSVSTAMLTLFQLVTGGRLWDETWRNMQKLGDLQAIFLVLYLVVYQLGIANLVVSMYVAKGSSLMKPVEDDLNWQSREDGIRIARQIEQVIDKKSSFIPGKMTASEFGALLDEPAMVDIMRDNMLSKQDALTLFSALLDADGSGAAEVASVVDGFTRMRGNASSLDMLTLMYEVKVAEKGKKEIASRTERKLDMLTKATSMNHLLGQTSLLNPDQDLSALKATVPAKPAAFNKPGASRSASVPPPNGPPRLPRISASDFDPDARTKLPVRAFV